MPDDRGTKESEAALVPRETRDFKRKAITGMARHLPVKGQAGWLLRKLVGNYWALAVAAVILGVPFALGVLALDRAGLAGWLVASDLAPVATSETARDFAGVAAGVNAAFISLYFSITLIVLSLAASNLGVRLIDRWLDKRLVRVSIAGLSFSLAVTLCAMLAIDPKADLAQTPLGLTAVVLMLQLVNLAMLAVSLHDLGRSMFVDRAIAALCRDAANPPATISVRLEGPSHNWVTVLVAPRDGYVEGIDCDAVAKAAPTATAIRICAAPGRHVARGEPLIEVAEGVGSAPVDLRKLARAVPIGDYRSDGQGTVFRVRLLVEIAARALSPAINDFYTALACADALMVVMREHRHTWVGENQLACWAHDPRVELPGQDFASLFGDPLAAFRQAAADYPSVSIRMIDNVARLIAATEAPDALHSQWHGWLADQVRAIAGHALSRAQHEADRRAIAARLDRFDRLSGDIRP
ncbi:DUF2254 family protein [Porphyrobacter sp. YT40]|uniref:DUF2254 family protein n=1 Tax=Porphyrobacter sp. YT40 TaxID=2547601 RepID=UPI001142EE0F|nr:DUF2254 family protein [Porphyrobacter sp. YT40]QDH34285.1 DUF2254 domain-containing protein [Porphyrobacter sp. YT40]